MGSSSQDRSFDIFAYMSPYLKVKALQSAFKLKLIDALAKNNGRLRLKGLADRFGLHKQGCDMLLNILRLFGIVKLTKSEVVLNSDFANDLRNNGLLIEALANYMDLAYKDLGTMPLTLMKGSSEGLIREFWGRNNSGGFSHLLTLFTQAEIAALRKLYDFGRHAYILDIGGNTGEFMVQLCRFFPKIKASVFDTPEVCNLGIENIKHSPDRRRIKFFPGDFFNDPFPEGADLITVKSVLHDWDTPRVMAILDKAYSALPAGGRILITEYVTDGCTDKIDHYLFEIVFMYLIDFCSTFRFRKTSEYPSLLRKAGFSDITAKKMPFANFCFIQAEKK